MGREDDIRLIAFRIWEEEGCLNGWDCEHWLRAESIWEKNQNPKTAAISIRNPATSVTARKKSRKP